MSEWLTKNEYARIRRKAKKMGCEDCQFQYIYHDVWFKHTIVSFAFYPLKYHVSIRNPDIFNGHFSTREEAEEIKRDIDLALEFIEYLKEFDSKLPKGGETDGKAILPHDYPAPWLCGMGNGNQTRVHQH